MAFKYANKYVSKLLIQKRVLSNESLKNKNMYQCPEKGVRLYNIIAHHYKSRHLK